MNLDRGFRLQRNRKPATFSRVTVLLLGLLLWFGSMPVFAASEQAYGLTEVDEGIDKVVRGLVRPVSRALLSSEIRGRVKSLGIRFGESFRQGDLLLSFDCSFYAAELAAKTAVFKAKQAQHRNNQKLLSLHATSEIEVEISSAQEQEAAADRRRAQVQVSHCEVHAPFDGALDVLYVNEHESVAPSDQLLSILSDGDLEIELIVPSDWLSWIKKGNRFQFLVDETATAYPAIVKQVGVSVDPVSQTVRLMGRFLSPVPGGSGSIAAGVLAGMSGRAIFERDR